MGISKEYENLLAFINACTVQNVALGIIGPYEFVNECLKTIGSKQSYSCIDDFESELRKVDFNTLRTGDIVIYRNIDNEIVGVVFGKLERQIIFHYGERIQVDDLSENEVLGLSYYQGFRLN